ncbi:uncharacterized protein I206_102289 [Kwoniella pini CBS 10737]|uniref:Uncharacterized protein n=1 Tax=Kwoniella pini CBS 10737 TaxID=1296096 RepID=A0A1B9HT34_9TREE|nr:uncharacterized protein I206_07659 [Kwoniella pini CBS 10737]OCF46425.1 hypothetical protein I206_07659 [Kwoniella pini CBS 10737]
MSIRRSSSTWIAANNLYLPIRASNRSSYSEESGNELEEDSQPEETDSESSFSDGAERVEEEQCPGCQSTIDFSVAKVWCDERKSTFQSYHLPEQLAETKAGFIADKDQQKYDNKENEGQFNEGSEKFVVPEEPASDNSSESEGEKEVASDESDDSDSSAEDERDNDHEYNEQSDQEDTRAQPSVLELAEPESQRLPIGIEC